MGPPAFNLQQHLAENARSPPVGNTAQNIAGDIGNDCQSPPATRSRTRSATKDDGKSLIQNDR